MSSTTKTTPTLVDVELRLDVLLSEMERFRKGRFRLFIEDVEKLERNFDDFDIRASEAFRKFTRIQSSFAVFFSEQLPVVERSVLEFKATLARCSAFLDTIGAESERINASMKSDVSDAKRKYREEPSTPRRRQIRTAQKPVISSTRKLLRIMDAKGKLGFSRAQLFEITAQFDSANLRLVYIEREIERMRRSLESARRRGSDASSSAVRGGDGGDAESSSVASSAGAAATAALLASSPMPDGGGSGRARRELFKVGASVAGEAEAATTATVDEVADGHAPPQDSQQDRDVAAATTIQRHWRGRSARLKVAKRRRAFASAPASAAPAAATAAAVAVDDRVDDVATTTATGVVVNPAASVATPVFNEAT